MFRIPWVTYKQRYEMLLKDTSKYAMENERLERESRIANRKFRNLLNIIKYLTSNSNSSIVKVIEKENCVELISCDAIKYGNITLKINLLNDLDAQYHVAYLCACYSDTGVFIEDIQCPPNRGYGSQLMTALISYCKNNGVDYITGELSGVDMLDEGNHQHAERLLHFYRKFGFEILYNKNYVPYKIYLKL